jgi:GlpG protein
MFDEGGPNPRFGGMSGVNYALFGFAWMTGRLRPHLGIGVAQQTVTVMMVWLFICMTG